MDTANLSDTESKSLKVFLELTEDFRGLGYFFMPMAGVPLAPMKKYVLSSHINKEHSLVYVRVKRIPKFFHADIETACASFRFVVRLKGQTFLVFSVLDVMRPSIDLIIQGRCTELELDAKALICRNSTLPFVKKEKGVFVTHYLLQALYKENSVRPILAICLDSDISKIPVELIGALPDESLIYIENWLSS